MNYSDKECDEQFEGTCCEIVRKEKAWGTIATVLVILPLVVSILLYPLTGVGSFVIWCVFYGGPLLFIESWNSMPLIALQVIVAVLVQIIAFVKIFRFPCKEASVKITLFISIWYLLGVSGMFYFFSLIGGDIGY